MFRELLEEAERTLGIDLDGDGYIGRPPTKEEQEAQAAAAVAPEGYYYPPAVHEDNVDNAYAEQQATQYVASGARCRALFIGINYIGSTAELKGCINDIRTVRTLLRSQGFPLTDIKVLAEDEQFFSAAGGYAGQPTKQNILDGLYWLTEDARPGDTLFLHYSGHGTSVRDDSGDEDDGLDEALVPVDYQRAGLIRDDDLFELTVRRLPQGVRLTAVLDCCHSGTLLDLPFNFSASENNLAIGKGVPTNRRRKAAANARNELPDVVMFSGCRDDQTSADVSNTASFDVPTASPGAAGGACSNALAETMINSRRQLTFASLLEKMRKNLQRRGFTQIPQLSSTKPIDLYDTFSFHGPIDNR